MTRTIATALITSIVASIVALVGAPGAFAAQRIITNPSGPLTNIYLNDGLGCQVNQAGELPSEFYGGTNPGACGTFIAAPAGAAATVHGPAVPAGNFTTEFTPVSQTALQGSGTDADPYTVRTVVDVAATGLRITQVDSYTVGKQFYTTRIMVRNLSASSQQAVLYHAGDCRLEGSDTGYGTYDAAGGGVFCSENADNSPPGRILGFVPVSGGSHYVEGNYGSVWDYVNGSVYPDSCACGTLEDNGAGLSWLITVPAGAVVTRSLATFSADMTAPATAIDSGPSGPTNDPTPSFSFSSSESGSSFECQLDSGAYAACNAPSTTVRLADGSHTFSVRATDAAGNTDPTPATRAFTVTTAEVRVSGSTLVVTAAPGAKDNISISRPSASVLRVSDFPSGPYTGSGVHTGPGCIPSGDHTANCSASGITLVKAMSGDQPDKVANWTTVRSWLDGEAAGDVLSGGSAKDTLIGREGADVLSGKNGNDELYARDLASDAIINCDGGPTPGGADKADLDLLPKDPDSAVVGCETKTRH